MGFHGLGKAAMDAMGFIFNRYPTSQAGRRGFDPRLPALWIKGLTPALDIPFPNELQ